MPFRRQLGDLERLYQDYKGNVAFLMVYVREAHPESLDSFLEEDKRPALHGPADSVGARCRLAGDLRQAERTTIPVVVDRPDNAVSKAYAAWTNRLVVVDAEGKVVYKSRRGPENLRAADLEKWLRRRPSAADRDRQLPSVLLTTPAGTGRVSLRRGHDLGQGDAT